MQTLVVVGASLGGLRAAEQARAQGFTGRLLVVGDERWRPYNRPPLSKESLLRAGRDVTAEEVAAALTLRTRLSAADAEWRLGSAAVAADLDRRTVTLADGVEVRYDGLVVATGLRPRRLPSVSPSLGRHALRTADDAAALRRDIGAGRAVVVVGGGFVGCETASTLAALGAEVTVVEPLPVPMARGVGVEVGAALLAHHRARGVRFVTGQGVAELLGAGDRVHGVLLDDGTVLDSDVVVESVGSQPNVEWLAGNGLDLTDGVLCDGQLRVEGRPDVVAVGDVARFPNHRYDDVARRVEHWCVPGDTARRAVSSLLAHLGAGPAPVDPFTPLPSFWSDQFGLRLQSYGAPALADQADVVEGDLDRLDGGVAVVHRRGGETVGALLVNVPAARHVEFRSLVLTPSLLV